MEELTRMMKRIIRKLKRILSLFISKDSDIEFEKNLKTGLKKRILDYYSHITPILLEKEIILALKYIKKNNVEVFPYKFVEKYKSRRIKVFYDELKLLSYVLHDGKRLYFKKFQTKEDIQKYYNWLLIEQDPKSPHKYINPEFSVKDGDVVIDIGAAEGNFSLSIIEKCSHLYLFEIDSSWIDSLLATFEPWKEKITIVQNYVSDVNTGNSITLDNFFSNINISLNFIKIDTEGAELKVLQGCKSIIMKNNNLKLAVCTYHNQDDEAVLTKYLEPYFDIKPVPSYMLFYYGDKGYYLEPPFFRRGIIQASKKQ